jgi:polysaccharide export outer membrane protein
MAGGFIRALLAAVGLSAAGCLHDGGHAPAVVVPPPGAVPRELEKVTMPEYVIEPPDVLLIEGTIVTPARDNPDYKPNSDKPDEQPKRLPGGITTLFTQDVSGQFTVRPDGTVYLGYFDKVQVAGYTLSQAAAAIRAAVVARLREAEETDVKPEQVFIKLDVTQYNTKYYYVIFDGGGSGEQITRVPFTGSDTVLDALSYTNGIPSVASKRNVWVARRTPHAGQTDQILPVDYVGVTQHGVTLTNYQLFPGDRVYVKAQRLVTLDTTLARVLQPVERIFGITLLGAGTVNNIQGRGAGFGGN